VYIQMIMVLYLPYTFDVLSIFYWSFSCQPFCHDIKYVLFVHMYICSKLPIIFPCHDITLYLKYLLLP